MKSFRIGNIEINDAASASICLENGSTPPTYNVKGFRFIKNLKTQKP